ncbi:structural protein P4, partial [Grapevine Cabernet Sauvignon reovirus]|uniref:structural protein P4 n=1 Tax=Grapevine Cabernet Sauvignon reovirus TaxID=1640277 RepID=UPI0006BC98EA
NQIIALLSNPIQFQYHYNKVTGTHSLKLQGLWASFYPCSLDMSQPLFEKLRNPNEEIVIEELIRLLKEMQLSITLPVPTHPMEHGFRYCYMLAWVARAYEYTGHVWAEILKRPEILCYNPDQNQKPLDEFMNLCDAAQTFTRVFGLKAYLLPGEVGVDLGSYTSVSASMSKKRVAWVRAIDFFNDFSYNHIPTNCWCAIHQTWAYDTPHFILFNSKQTFADYLIQKIRENRICFKEFYDGLGGQMNRVTEAVAVFCKNDFQLLKLARIQHNQKDIEAFLTCHGAKSGAEYLQSIELSRPSVEDIGFNGAYFDVTQAMYQSLISSNRPMWLNINIIPNEIAQEWVRDEIILGEGTPNEDVIKWAELPLGEQHAFDSQSSQVIARLTSEFCPMSTLLHSVSVLPDDQGEIQLEIGRGVIQLPKVEQRIVDEDERTGAQEIYDTKIEDKLWQIRQTGRVFGLTSRAISELRTQIKEARFGKVPAYSCVHLLQNLLFSDPDTIVGEYIAKPSIRARNERLNSSSLKLLSVFLFLCRSILNLTDDMFDLTRQNQIPLISKILIGGAIDDPFVRCLKKTYPNIKIMGFGLDAISPNIRMSVEGSSFKNMSCGILISDIDQAMYDTFDEMVNSTCEHVIAFVSWASMGAIKINHPSAYLFNTIQDRLDQMDQRVYIFPFQVTYQNIFTPECFLMFHSTNRFHNGEVKNYFSSQDNIFEMKAKWLSASNKNYQLPFANNFNRVLTKRQLSVESVAPCGYFSITVPFMLAPTAVEYLLEVCNQVTSWKVERGTDVVNLFGRISKDRMALTQRTERSIQLFDSKSYKWTAKSFGTTSKKQNFSAMISMPWYTVIAEAARLMMVDITEKIFDEGITKYCAIGSRNLTESYALRKYPVRCFDEYYANGQRVKEVYDIDYCQRAYRYGREPIIDREGIMANFCLMSSLKPDSTVADSEAGDQCNKISSMVNAMKAQNFLQSCFMCSLYLNSLPEELDYGSENLPLGLKFVAPDRITFGDYLPISSITLDQLAEVLGDDCSYVRYAMVSFDWVLKACNLHGWVPSVAGASGLTLSEKLVVLIFVSPYFDVSDDASRANLVKPLPREVLRVGNGASASSNQAGPSSTQGTNAQATRRSDDKPAFQSWVDQSSEPREYTRKMAFPSHPPIAADSKISVPQRLKLSMDENFDRGISVAGPSHQLEHMSLDSARVESIIHPRVRRSVSRTHSESSETSNPDLHPSLILRSSHRLSDQ